MANPETTNRPCPPGPPHADAYLRGIGIRVEPQDIPGLYRINGGPELTYGQMLGELGRMVSEASEPVFSPARALAVFRGEAINHGR